MFALSLGFGCAESSGNQCNLNSDCLNAYCLDGVCTQDCVDAAKDCPKGYVCNAIAQCEYGGPSSGGAGAQGGEGAAGASGPSSGGAPNPSAGGGGDGGSGAAGAAGGSGPGSGGGGNGPELVEDLTLCQTDEECLSDLCRDVQVGGVKRCTKTCSVSTDCYQGFRCEEAGGIDFCRQSDVGEPCSGAAQCNFACLSPLNHCTSQCVTGNDCPNGYGCSSVGNTKVCVRLAADCAADTSQCMSAQACDTSLVVSSCTMPCSSSADCPQRAAGLPAWTCDGFCRRPPDVYGPLPGGTEPAQWACNFQSQVVNVCNDGLHIDFDAFTQPPAPAVSCAASSTTDGFPGDACLDSCKYRGGCPSGFGCVAAAEIGGSLLGLCLIVGSEEVGSSCTSNSECAFGLCKDNVCSRDCSRDQVCPSGSTCTPEGGPLIEGMSYKTCQ